MESAVNLSHILSEIGDQLALGLAMFGDHAFWIFVLPVFWVIAASLIWAKTASEEDERNSAYVANAERNLPKLRELAKQRATEILDIRSID